MGTIEETAMQAAAENVMAKFGKSANYKPGNGEPVSCTVHLDEDVKMTPDGLQYQVVQPKKTIEALLHEIGQVPKKGDVFEIESYAYTVKGVIDLDAWFVLMDVSGGSQI